MPTPSGLFERALRSEQRGNRDVRDLWDRYRGHREQVTAATLALAPSTGGRLCLLGAGNGNDLDLVALAARFEEIHLVDIDAGALARAVGRQPPAVRARLRCHAPVDLSGLYQQLDQTTEPAPSVDTLVTAGTAAVSPQLPAGADVAVSCCVLSQMSWALQRLASEGQAPGALPLPLPLLEQALLRIHLRTLLGLIDETGAALLVADMISTAAYPLDELEPDEDLAALARKLASDRVAYAVCNPELVRQMLRRDPELGPIAAPPVFERPWLWDGPKDETYLVYPAVLRRRHSRPDSNASSGGPA